jgi:hypothetical protein
MAAASGRNASGSGRGAIDGDDRNTVVKASAGRSAAGVGPVPSRSRLRSSGRCRVASDRARSIDGAPFVGAVGGDSLRTAVAGAVAGCGDEPLGRTSVGVAAVTAVAAVAVEVGTIGGRTSGVAGRPAFRPAAASGDVAACCLLIGVCGVAAAGAARSVPFVAWRSTGAGDDVALDSADAARARCCDSTAVLLSTVGEPPGDVAACTA